MKKFINLFGITALIAVMGFSFAALSLTGCGGGGGGSPAAPVLTELTGTVTITGSPSEGEILRANTASLDGSGAFSYQWKRGGTATIGTSPIYVVQPADEGFDITVTVTCSGNTGSKTSAPVRIVARPVILDIPVSNAAEWNAALETVKNGGNGAAASLKAYTITVSGNFMVNGSAANSFGSASYIAVTIKGNGTLYLLGQGSLLNITSNQTVYLDSADLTLQGLKLGQNDSSQDNNKAVVSVSSGSTLELRNGTIRDNNGGSGVSSSGSFIMSGGTITGNTYSNGGGVYITGGSFTMTGGTITGNAGRDNSGSGYGGGVYITGGSFTMSGGIISNNSCGSTPASSGDSFLGHGGGVYVNSGSFTMTGGTITGNSARGGINQSAYSGGELLYNFGILIGSPGSYLVGGGGVCVSNPGSSNPGSFTKTDGGIISGNDATAGTSTIYGNPPNGKEVLLESSSSRYRDTPLGTADDIDTNTLTGWNQ